VRHSAIFHDSVSTGTQGPQCAAGNPRLAISFAMLGARFGQGILEMRVDYGPGYRIYYVHRGAQIVILLCGGDKRTQQQDINRAQKLAETLRCPR